jgi:propanediol dehydratase small subunit
MRRDLERGSTSRVQQRRSMAVSTHELESVLEELIAALDRRVPRVEQAGEADIARDAAALRAKAVDRLAELVRGTPLPPPTSVGEAT